MAEQIQFIYDLKTIGFSEIHQQLGEIQKDFERITKSKKAAEQNFASSKVIGDIAKYDEELKELVKTEQQLRVQMQQLQNEQKAEQILRQQAINEEKQRNKELKDGAGFYFRLTREIRELGNAIKSVKNQGDPVTFRGETFQFDDAIRKLQQLTSAEQDFRRQFARDRTLVGEYTTGIVQAFKQMGLDDLIAGQVTRTQNRLNELNNSFNNLQNELQQTRAAGQSTDTIEKQMIENRNEVIKLDTELARLKTDLRGTGDIGNQISTSLNKGFTTLKNQLGSLVFQFVGIQAAINGIRQGFSDTVQLDSLNAALKSVSGTTEEFARNQEFLTQTTDRLGLSLLDSTSAFKSFFAAATQAGLSADQSREIFEAAASASANLKLSQDQVNGVLLAFGQIASKGTVQAEELRGQIGERIPGAFSIAAKAIGVSQQELNKMLEQGQVLANDFLPKFARELQKTFGVETGKRVQGLQASINRLRNEFTNLLEQHREGITSFFQLLINSAGVLIKLLPVLVVALAAYSAEVLRSYVVTQLATKGTVLWNISLVAQRAGVLLANIALTAYYGTIALLTGGLTRATVATRILGAAFKAFPLGIILTIAAVLAGAFTALARSVSGSNQQLSEHARKQLALNEVNQEATKIYTRQIAEIQTWSAVLRNANASVDTQKKAVEELTKINAEFSGVMKDNIVDLNELERVTKKVTDAILKRARAEASASLVAKQQARTTNLAVAREVVDIATTQGGDLVIDTDDTDLPKEVVDILKKTKGVKVVKNIFGGSTLAVTQKNLAKVVQDFNDQQTKAAQDLQDLLDIQADADKQLADFIGNATESGKQFEVDVAKLKKEIEQLDKQINSFQGSQKDLQKKIEERNRKQAELDRLLGNERGSRTRAPLVTGEQKNALKDIDALRDAELTSLELAFRTRQEFKRREQELIRITEEGKIQIVRESQSVQIRDQEEFLKEELEINVNAINQKMEIIQESLLNQDQLLKKANARQKVAIEKAMASERAQFAALQLEKVRLENETQEKIFDIRAKLLKDQLDTEVQQTIDVVTRVKEDPNISDTDKAQAQLDADKAILELQIQFNKDMDALEKDRRDISKKNAQDRANEILKIETKLRKDQKDLLEAEIVDANDAAKKAEAEIKIRAATATIDVLQSGKSPRKQAEELLQIQRDATRELQINEAARLANELALYEKGVIQKLKTEKDYQEALARFKELEAKIIEDNINRQTTAFERFVNSLRTVVDTFKESVLGIKQYSDDAAGAAEKHADAVAQTQATIKQTISEAFDLVFAKQNQQVEREKDIALQRLENETNQLKAKAQSDQEVSAIEKNAEQRRKNIEKKAGEEKKKIALKELAINFALSIMKSLAQFGLPLALIPIAAQTALYAVQRSAIQSQQFEFGGQPGKEKRRKKVNIPERPVKRARGGDVPTRGGQFKGKPHSEGGTPFVFKGQQYEAEVDELAIVRTKNAPKDRKFKVEGTQMEIASAINRIGGGVDFKPGAKIRKFDTGGFIGQSLQAPTFTPNQANLNAFTRDNSDIVDAIKELRDDAQRERQELRNKVDRIEVVQVTRSVTDAQRKQVRQDNVGTL